MDLAAFCQMDRGHYGPEGQHAGIGGHARDQVRMDHGSLGWPVIRIARNRVSESCAQPEGVSQQSEELRTSPASMRVKGGQGSSKPNTSVSMRVIVEYMVS